MALAHFHAGTVSRGAGRSAVDAAAYVLRVNMLDQRTGTSYSNGRNAADAVYTFVWLPKNAPEQYRDAEALANYMESRETRSNSRTARTIEAALPHELTDEQRQLLVKDFAREFTRKGLAVMVGIHKPHEHGDDRNHHFHMVISTRTMDAQGLGAKLRDLDKVETLEAWRERWETLTNKQLERHGHLARIDMRSFDRQGREGAPQIHMGPVVAALERKGIETDRGDQVRSVRAEREQQDQEKGRTWTDGRALRAELAAEPVPIVSAVERQVEEDRQARAAAQRQEARDQARAASVPFHLRMLAGALRVLRGSAMMNTVMGRIDEATIAASMREAKRQQIPEKVKEQAPRRKQAKVEQEPRTFVDRGRRPAPYHALVGELRDNERDSKQPETESAAAAVWSHETQPPVAERAASPATPGKPMSFLAQLEVDQRMKGQTLADLLPKQQRQRKRDRSDGLGHDLEL